MDVMLKPIEGVEDKYKGQKTKINKNTKSINYS